MRLVAMLPRALIAAWALLACAPGAAESQFVQGLILYTDSDRPLASATVHLVDEEGVVRATTLSSEDGRFALPVPADGRYFVHVEHWTAWAMVDGPLDLGVATNAFVTFHVVPQPIALDGMEVEVVSRPPPLARVGFLRRRDTSSGFFLDPDQIEARHPIRPRDLLTGVPGLQFVDSPGKVGFSGFPLMSWTLRNRLDPRPCFPTVYVDGVIVEGGGALFRPQVGFDEIVETTDIMAMEIYRSPAEFPVAFGGLTACGVIVIWTKRGDLR